MSVTESDFDRALEYSIFHSDMTRSIKAIKIIDVDGHYPEQLERAKNKMKRNELKSRHGITAERFDQFYRDHKLLLKLFLFLGVMPIVRSAPGRITFRWKSPQMIYAALLYVVTTTLVVLVGYERVRILRTTKEFDELIYAIIFLIFLIPHFWIPYVGWGAAAQVADYKTMWGSFQVRYYRVTGTTLTFTNLNLLIVILFIGCVLVSIVFLGSLTNLLDGFLFKHTIAYFHIITMINMNAALFYINLKAVKEASLKLSICFEKDIRMQCSSALIYQYRLLFLNLSEILQAFGTAYTRTYSTYYLFMTINIIISAYGTLSGLVDAGFSYKVLGLVVLLAYCCTLLFIICDCSYQATAAVCRDVQNTLLSANVVKMGIQAQREIDFFISAIELNPAMVDMQGFGFINRELLSSTITTITIYLLILVQFKISFGLQQSIQI